MYPGVTYLLALLSRCLLWMLRRYTGRRGRGGEGAGDVTWGYLPVGTVVQVLAVEVVLVYWVEGARVQVIYPGVTYLLALLSRCLLLRLRWYTGWRG